MVGFKLYQILFTSEILFKPVFLLQVRGSDLAQREQQVEHRPQREDRHRLHLALRQPPARTDLRRGKQLLMTSLARKHALNEES